MDVSIFVHVRSGVRPQTHISLEAGKMRKHSSRSQRVVSETFYLLQYSQMKAEQMFIL